MKIYSHTMLGTHHSWSVTMRSYIKEFIKDGHEVSLNSSNGYDQAFPEEWKNIVKNQKGKSDLSISYVLPLRRNMLTRFHKKSRVKAVIYNYESSILPQDLAEGLKMADLIFPSSNFSRDIFIDAGIPEEKCVVIPHGIDISRFDNTEKYLLGNKKSFRFLSVGIPHHRKNLPLLLSAYYDAFSSDDDVALVLKTSFSPPKKRKRYRFEADLLSEFKAVQKRFKGKKGGLPQVEVIQSFLPDMVPLYNSCDVLISATSSEGFGIPFLEGMAAGLLVVAPRCSGHLDFLSDSNSLLYDTQEVDAGEKYQYWSLSEGAKTFIPNQDDVSQAFLDSYHNNESLRNSFDSSCKKTLSKFTWEAASKKIIETVNDF